MKIRIIILLICCGFLSSCMTSKGLYPENRFRNRQARQQMEKDQWRWYVN